jgi:RHS repeat-associated protein
MLDATGAVVARYEYDFWGVRSKLGGSVETPWGYTGHYTHADTGLVLAPYRAYDPETGRWLSRDPIGENGGINLYGYVGNNPVNRKDPLGLTYLNLNFSFGFVVGVTGGIIWDNSGFHPYAGFGVMTSPGICLTVSPNEKNSASTGLWGASVSGGAMLVGGVGVDSSGSTAFEYGLGTPGIQGVLTYTWK